MHPTIDPALLDRRYGPGSAEPALPTSPTIDALLDHRSVRAYADRPLPPGTVEALVAAASSAPTSSNLQTWSVVAVEDPARRERLSRLCANQAFIRQAPLFLVWLADLSRLDRLGATNGQQLEGLEYLETFMVALIDAALAAQNALTAAESLGLGTVYVGALRNRPAEVAAELNLPPNVAGAFGLCVGFPDPAAATAVKPRLPQSVVLHREQYESDAEPGHLTRYDATLTAFSKANGMGPAGWIPRVLSRVGSGSSLSGRDRMREILNGLGFKLR